MNASVSRAKILQAASELFLQGGLAALSVRAISTRAGLSTIGIYSHFEGKQGILDALYIEGFERVANAMDIQGKTLDSNARLLAACNAYLDVAEQYSAHYRLIFGAADDTYTPSIEARSVAAQVYQKLLDLVAQFLPPDASMTQVQSSAIEMWAILHGYVGLKNHAVAQEVNLSDWRQLALRTVTGTLSGLGRSG